MRKRFSARRRAVVVGLDGVPASLLARGAAEGWLPSTAKLLDDGTMGAVASTAPPVSSVAWATLTTGVDPSRHGVYGFVDLKPDSYSLRFPNSADVRMPRIWDAIGAAGRRSIVLNVPGTYPAQPMEGCLVAGFVAPRLDRAVYPAGLLARLERLAYKTDVDAVAAQRDVRVLEEELFTVLDARLAAWWQLWEEDWDLFFGVLTETDRLHHFLWGPYEAGDAWAASLFERLYARVDAHLGEVTARLGDNAALAVVSDHGFCRIRHELYLNDWLAANGFCAFTAEAPASLNDLAPGSRAFALDPGRIYVNVEGRFPLGCVPAESEAEVVDEIAEALGAVRDPDSVPVVGRLLRRSEAYTRAALDGPSLVLLPADGVDPKAPVGRGTTFGQSTLTGMHTHDDATLYWRGAGPVEDLEMRDLAPSIAAHLNVEVTGWGPRHILPSPAR